MLALRMVQFSSLTFSTMYLDQVACIQGRPELLERFYIHFSNQHNRGFRCSLQQIPAGCQQSNRLEECKAWICLMTEQTCYLRIAQAKLYYGMLDVASLSKN